MELPTHSPACRLSMWEWSFPPMTRGTGPFSGRRSGTSSVGSPLLTQLNDCREQLDQVASARSFAKHQHAALSLLQSRELASALDLRLEKAKTRELYGQSLFGQSCLAARRLIEAGSRVVSV